MKDKVKGWKTQALPRAWWWLGGLVLMGAASRGLRFGGGFGLWAHWDEVRLAIPALAILQGDNPIHHLGVEYMGALSSYLMAPWFLLFGSSPLALDCFLYIISLALWGSGYLVAREFSGRRAAVLCALVSAVPPLAINQLGFYGGLNYPFLLLLGNLLLVSSRLVFFTDKNSAFHCLLVGLLAGLGSWNHMLVLVYLLPIALLALRSGLWFKKRFWFLPLGFGIGSLPVWLYEWGHFPSARFAPFQEGAVSVGFGTKGMLLLADSFPRLLGIEPDKLGGSGMSTMVISLVLFLTLLLITVLSRDAGEMAWLAGRRTPPAAGRIILWGVLASNLVLVLFTPRGNEIGGTGIRYLLPLFSLLPVWMGEALERLWAWRKTLAVGILAGWLGFQSWINWQDTFRSTAPGERRWEALRQVTEPLRAWLEARGIRRIYLEEVPGITSYEFTFLTGGRIVAADPWREEYLPYALLVDEADRPPFVTGRNPTGPGPLTLGTVEALKALGWEPKIDEVGAFEVVTYEGQGPGSYEALSPRGWRPGAYPHPEMAGTLIDRSAQTGWTTNEPQRPGQMIVIDLGGRERLGRMDLWTPLWQDIPRGFRLEGSLDGTSWQMLAEVTNYRGPFFFAGPHPFLKVRQGRVPVVFSPRVLRYLRFTQTGKADLHSWTVHEIFLFRPTEASAEIPSVSEIFGILEGERVGFFYADPWLSAGISRLSRGAVRTMPFNLYVNSYGRIDPEPHILQAAALQQGTALFLNKAADGAEVRKLLGGQPAVWKAVPVRAGTLIIFGFGERDRPLPRENWQVTVGDTRERIQAVLDGKNQTGWKPDGLKGPRILRLDLGDRRSIQRLRLDLETQGEACRPVVTVSQDGHLWEGLDDLSWSGPLVFNGWDLLRYGEKRWDVRFPVRRVRYLQLAFPPGPRGWEVREVFGYDREKR